MWFNPRKYSNRRRWLRACSQESNTSTLQRRSILLGKWMLRWGQELLWPCRSCVSMKGLIGYGRNSLFTSQTTANTLYLQRKPQLGQHPLSLFLTISLITKKIILATSARLSQWVSVEKFTIFLGLVLVLVMQDSED